MSTKRKNHFNYYLEEIDGIKCQLELGKWSVDSINLLLDSAWGKYAFPSRERLMYITQQFLCTPFCFESNLPILEDGVLRVRLEDFDCITFIYYMLALCNSYNFIEFAHNLYRIRYLSTEKKLICNNPDIGNIFDFPCDSILKNATEMRLLYDITTDLIDSKYLETMSVELKRFKRPKAFDKDELFVTPKFGERTVTDSFITSSHFDKVDFTQLSSGDIVVFSRGPINKDGSKASLLIGHFAFVCKENDNVHFIHVTRNYRRRITSQENDRYSTGVFYDDDQKCEQLGVCYGGVFAGDEFTLTADIGYYHCFDQNIKRTLSDYFLNNFWGMKIFRVGEQESILPLVESKFKNQS